MMDTDNLLDVRKVRCLAILLDVSEMEIFRLASKYWFNTEDLPNDEELRTWFNLYLLEGFVTPWVRHYVRMEIENISDLNSMTEYLYSNRYVSIKREDRKECSCDECKEKRKKQNEKKVS